MSSVFCGFGSFGLTDYCTWLFASFLSVLKPFHSSLGFHDIQAKSPPDSSFVSNQSRDADRPPNGCGGYTPVKLGVHLQAGGPRNFPGAK